jgi:hypothetical protein
MSELVRADQLTSLFVSDGAPDNRTGEDNRRGVLWAHLAGQVEPVRLDGFAGITAAELLDTIAKTVAEATKADGPVAYIRLHHTGGRASITSVRVSTSFPEQTDDGRTTMKDLVNRC